MILQIILLIILIAWIILGIIVDNDTPWWHHWFVIPPMAIFLIYPYWCFDFVYEKITGRSSFKK